ncbi:alpha/beta fold hydrolase [Blastococcus haudaquaticus]|uniref:2-succinyl-6-hydroxy-2,4-cyclohexadiene-1-carboxylate synthase n=1 Tax=Blastococcus haudaquaticus TaxID=1938745 RepID=A0A286GW45_9ACTN|nr:alpha/beta fold hydrolase [Blastococcus haudaquaticus]SOD99406.1 2-succinyl-6-hydroxy-2,4-cyclohexadiene-1-carboxylate synthase [Blastococcus haudaquaticus]
MSLWTDALGSEIRFVDVGGVRTRILRTGSSGPLLLLLHGRGGHLETWTRNHAGWADGRQVVAADLLGHGLTERAGSRYDVGELLEHTEHLVDALLAETGESDLDVVGQSLGGWVAAWLTRRRPGTVRRLVLVEPAGLQSEAERLADPRVAAAYERGGRAFTAVTADNVRLRLRQLLQDPAAVDEEMVELRRRLYEPPGAADVHSAVRAADNGSWLLTPDWWRAHRTPTLFVRGEHGHLPGAVLDRLAASLPDARVVTVPGAKQWPHYENPLDVTAAVEYFLQEDLP